MHIHPYKPKTYWVTHHCMCLHLHTYISISISIYVYVINVSKQIKCNRELAIGICKWMQIYTWSCVFRYICFTYISYISAYKFMHTHIHKSALILAQFQSISPAFLPASFSIRVISFWWVENLSFIIPNIFTYFSKS